MPRGVNEVHGIRSTILGFVLNGHRMGLDRDPPLPLQVHIIQHLVTELTLINGLGQFKHAVGKRRLPMINMGNNTKISNMAKVGHRFNHLTF